MRGNEKINNRKKVIKSKIKKNGPNRTEVGSPKVNLRQITVNKTRLLIVRNLGTAF